MENSLSYLIISIVIIILVTILSIIYIRNKISKPFNYLIQQIENKDIIDKSKLNQIFEYEKVSYLYERLRDMQIDIENKNQKLKGDNKDFIISSIHQLKTPLSAISMNLELMEMHDYDPCLQEYIDQIKASIDMLNLNSEELAYLSIKDDVEYKIKQLDISQAIKERYQFFEQIASSNEKKIKLNIEDNITININDIEFERFIDNNISNAIKYSRLNSTIEINLSQKEKDIEVSFISDGKAIKEPKKVFNKYYRESKDQNGYGLGLYIIKTICDKYNIKIEVFSYNNKNIFKYSLNVT
jgi:signal transduction histidine kinase